MTIEPILKWARRHMRRPGPLPDGRDVVAKAWHIQSPLGSGTYCGVNVTRYAGDRRDAPFSSPPDGDLCRKCLRQYALGYVLPQGRGQRKRRAR